METNVHQMLWGSHTEPGLTSAMTLQGPFESLHAQIEQALTDASSSTLVRAVRLTREKRVVDGLICDGYSITVTLSVHPDPLSPDQARIMECQIESQISVALLDVLCPVQVDLVATLI